MRRSRHRAGVLLADVADHDATDAMIAATLHHAFLVGVSDELDAFGEITTKLFEHLKTRFYVTTIIHEYFTMIYGELSDSGRLRFLSAGHPRPVVWSEKYRCRDEISKDRLVSYTPMGMFLSAVGVDDRRRYRGDDRERPTVDEINRLGAGDVLLPCTDGLSDHEDGRWLDERLAACFAEADSGGAEAVADAVVQSLDAQGPASDDRTFVVLRHG